MNPQEIARQIKAGASVQDVADSLGVTASAVYLTLRRAGLSVHTLRAAPKRGRVEFRELPGEPAYRVGSNGTVQTCLNNRGSVTDVWKDLKLQASPDRPWPLVQTGSRSAGTRQRRSIETLIRAAFGADADAILKRLRRKLDQ